MRLPPGEAVGSQLDRFIVNGAKGYTVFVPPGATILTVEFRTTRGAAVELLTQTGRDVGTGPTFRDRADFRGDPDGNGLITIQVKSFDGLPRLTSGIYFIGFRLRNIGIVYEGVLTATVAGPVIEPEVRVQESIFSDDLDGWTRNDTASPIPGTNVGSPSSTLKHQTEGGNPGGLARLDHRVFFGPDEWFLAPDKYLIDFMVLDGPRFQFDLIRINGDTSPNFNVQIRVFNDTTGYTWNGRAPPVTSEGWQTFQATIREGFWRLSFGEDSFAEVFSAPKRIEVRALFVIGIGTAGLDNFRILARGGTPPIPVLPTVTSFSAGPDGWGRNYPAPFTIPLASTGDEDTDLVWVDVEGNPGGYLRVATGAADAGDAFVVGREFLGDLTGLDQPRFEFDFLHRSTPGASEPVEIRLIGRTAVYSWTGVTPADVWAHQVAPITAEEWTLTAGEGSFADVLADLVRIEISADLAPGPEGNCLDNFALLTSDTPPLPQTITANPPTLDFPGVAGLAKGAGIARQILRISSGGGSLRWEAEASGELADRVSLSQTSGDTPSTVFVDIDPSGLPSGVSEGRITFTASGANIPVSDVDIRLILDPQPIPTPLINDDGVVSAAIYTVPLSPGILVSLFGRDLGGPVTGFLGQFGGRTGDRLPTRLGGVRVLVFDQNDNLIAEAPMLYISDIQINFQLPFSVFGHTVVRIVVEFNGIRSEPRDVRVQSWAPGVFTFGENRAVAANGDGSINTSANPVETDALLTIYMTGQGVVAPAWPAGRAAPAFPLVRAPSDIHVTIGGVEARVQFFGLAPGMAGVAQLNVFPAPGTPPGDQLLVVWVGGVPSNAAIVSIQ